MSSTIELPPYDNEFLAACTISELIENMIRDEDRVPRNLINECVRRDEQMLESLASITEPNEDIESEVPGYCACTL